MQNYTDAALLDLVGFALDHAVDSLRAGGLVPFVVMETPQGRHLARCFAEPYEVGVSQARALVAVPPADAERVLVCYDGFLTVDGSRTDAILIDAQDCRRPYSATFALRYRPASDEQPMEILGDPMFTGPGEPLARPTTDAGQKPATGGLARRLGRLFGGRR